MSKHTTTPATAGVFAHAPTRERYTLTLAIAQATRRRDRRRNASLHETPRERDARVYGALGVRYCSTLPNPNNTFTPPPTIMTPAVHTRTIIVYDESGAFAANARVPIHHTDMPFETRARIFTSATDTLPARMTLVHDTSAPDAILHVSLETGVEPYRVVSIDI